MHWKKKEQDLKKKIKNTKGKRIISCTIQKKELKLPKHALTNVELIYYAKKLKISHFRGVFMRDTLPLKIRKHECGIINLDISSGTGTHWTAYAKKGCTIIYYDSYGNLKPPKELIKYFYSGGYINNIKYNYNAQQKYNSYNCGHLCLKFLYKACL